MKPRFVHYREGAPRYKVVMGSALMNVSVETLAVMGIPVPATPMYQKWLKYIATKQRCPNCWRVTRNGDDLKRHYETNGCKPEEVGR